MIDRADVVFTGGSSLYEAKKGRHANIHSFPSCVDRAHFARRARGSSTRLTRQTSASAPRLLRRDRRADGHRPARPGRRCASGLVVRHGRAGGENRSEDDLPGRPNIHYLGGKTYDELPAYLSGWDVALMPFAINKSTQFISPTKTPEYLAGGKPVVSTPIKDVVRHYGHSRASRSRDARKSSSPPATRRSSCRATAERLAGRGRPALSAMSWDITQARMAGLSRRARHPRGADRRSGRRRMIAAAPALKRRVTTI